MFHGGIMKTRLFLSLLLLGTSFSFAYAQDDLESTTEEIVAPTTTPTSDSSMDSEMPTDSSSIYIPEESSEGGEY